MIVAAALSIIMPLTEATPLEDSATPSSKSISESSKTCHNCHHPCPPQKAKTNIKFPNFPSVTYGTNCDFCDHELYTLTCIETVFDCSSRCAIDRKCSHFTYIADLKGGTCILKNAPGSGGSWASAIPSPSSYMCGYIPKRALVDFFLNICLGKDILSGRR